MSDPVLLALLLWGAPVVWLVADFALWQIERRLAARRRKA